MRDAVQLNEPERVALGRELGAAVAGEVRFGAGDIALYANDASNYRQPPIGVVIPKTIADVVATHRICRAWHAPILSRGAGTSLSGETVNYAVVMDHSKYLDHILDIDPQRRLVTAETGVINDKLNQALGPYGLVFPPDPSTHKWCTIGGNVGNNSCGVHSVQAQIYGPGPRTADNVHALEVLTYDGEQLTLKDRYEEHEIDGIIAAGGRQGEIFAALKALRDKYADEIRARFPRIEKLPRRVSGYNLDDLLPENGFNLASALTGTEGTCVTVLHVTFKLTEQVKHRTLMVIGFENIAVAADHVSEIMHHRPIALEGLDHQLFEDERREHMHPEELSQLPEGKAWLLVEFGGGDGAESDAKAQALIDELKHTKDAPQGYSIIDDKEQEAKLWAVREAGLGATAFPPDGRDHWPGWEDSAVPPERVGDYLRDLKKLYGKYGYRGALYGHLGQGCVHSRISFELHTSEGVKQFRAFMEEAGDLVVSYGGTLSGEHGDGQARAELLEKMFGGKIMRAFREFKRIWDPEWKMNPGKVIDPYKLDDNLRLVNYHPWRTRTGFEFPHDKRDFGRVAIRCVGVGKCRGDGGTMCPSYMATREEKHATRGRARLLFEMMQGDVLRDGWRSEAVKESLDLCLSCKGCKRDCPVNVDMATYKAEFLWHYYRDQRRPLNAWAFGWIDRWSRLASRAPGTVNFLTHAPGLAALAKSLAGVAPERDIPRYARRTFQSRFKKHEVRNPEGPPVVFWADTFNNHFFPDVAEAGVEVLESAGYRVRVPPRGLCCGRPLYEFGMLDHARRYLEQVMTSLKQEIDNGVPIVGLEPSCISVFRDELPNLFPDDRRAQRLSRQSCLLSEFLENVAEDYRPPQFARQKALVHAHCHHKSIMGVEAETSLLDKLGLKYELLNSGCCGMAGSFGFTRDKYPVSLAAGERVLLPKVREADDDTLIVANGFSCREQIRQTTNRRALDLAQVIQLALRENAGGPHAGAAR